MFLTTMWIMGNFFVVIFLCHEGKTEHDKKQAAEDLGKHDVNWGQWGACMGSCGLGHRSRTGCHKLYDQRAKGKCLLSSTEETGDCSLAVLCSSSSKNFPGQLTSSVKSSSPLEVLPSALPVTLQPSTPQPIKTISMTSTANGQRKSTPIATSSTSMMTSILEGTFRERMQTQTVSPVTTTSLKPSFVSDIQSSTARLHEETQNVSEYVDKQGVPRSQAHFSVTKDKILLRHTIDEMWASNEVKCAMLCLRNPNCKSFNFKSTTGDTCQEKDTIFGQYPKNCLLNAAMRLTFTEDLVVKHGWTYFYRTN